MSFEAFPGSPLGDHEEWMQDQATVLGQLAGWSSAAAGGSEVGASSQPLDGASQPLDGASQPLDYEYGGGRAAGGRAAGGRAAGGPWQQDQWQGDVPPPPPPPPPPAIDALPVIATPSLHRQPTFDISSLLNLQLFAQAQPSLHAIIEAKELLLAAHGTERAINAVIEINANRDKEIVVLKDAIVQLEAKVEKLSAELASNQLLLMTRQPDNEKPSRQRKRIREEAQGASGGVADYRTNWTTQQTADIKKHMQELRSITGVDKIEFCGRHIEPFMSALKVSKHTFNFDVMAALGFKKSVSTDAIGSKIDFVWLGSRQIVMSYRVKNEFKEAPPEFESAAKRQCPPILKMFVEANYPSAEDDLEDYKFEECALPQQKLDFNQLFFFEKAMGWEEVFLPRVSKQKLNLLNDLMALLHVYAKDKRVTFFRRIAAASEEIVVAGPSGGAA